MSTGIELKESSRAWEPPAVKPLDEDLWEAWKAKGRAHDRKRHLAQVKVVRWASVSVLLAAAILGSRLAPYELLVRTLVFASLIALTWQSLRARQIALAAAFGLIAVLYTPVAPAFSFASSWDRAVLVASSIPLVIFLVWRNVKEPRHV